MQGKFHISLTHYTLHITHYIKDSAMLLVLYVLLFKSFNPFVLLRLAAVCSQLGLTPESLIPPNLSLIALIVSHYCNLGETI